jgi:predicted transcriptional regulator YdeE
LSERYDSETSVGIPAQWQRFAPYVGHIPGQVGQTTYGVLCHSDDAGNAEYICGVEVSDFSEVPAELSRLRVPEQRYAVFTHRDHISTIRRTWFTIWNKWLPESGYQAAEGPEFERYGKEFDPRTGAGGLQIWVPIKRLWEREWTANVPTRPAVKRPLARAGARSAPDLTRAQSGDRAGRGINYHRVRPLRASPVSLDG